jgi:hypothetical protein
MIFFLLLLLASDPTMPDRAKHPGAVNPKISAANKGRNVCAGRKWSTGSIRPPESYTNKLKRQEMQALGYTLPDPKAKCMDGSGNPECYELDHLISLEIGGAPADPKNLWVEPWHRNVGGEDHGAKTKDGLEDRLHALVCAGSLSLEQAQREISVDWKAAYRKYVGPFPKFDPAAKMTN